MRYLPCHVVTMMMVTTMCDGTIPFSFLKTCTAWFCVRNSGAGIAVAFLLY